MVEKRLSGSSLVSCVQFLNEAEGLITQPTNQEYISKDDDTNTDSFYSATENIQTAENKTQQSDEKTDIKKKDYIDI